MDYIYHSHGLSGLLVHLSRLHGATYHAHVCMGESLLERGFLEKWLPGNKGLSFCQPFPHLYAKHLPIVVKALSCAISLAHLEAFGKSFNFPLLSPSSSQDLQFMNTLNGVELGACNVPCSDHWLLPPGWSSNLQFAPWSKLHLSMENLPIPPTVGCLEISPPCIPWEMANLLTMDLLDPSLTWSPPVRSNDFHCFY